MKATSSSSSSNSQILAECPIVDEEGKSVTRKQHNSALGFDCIIT